MSETRKPPKTLEEVQAGDVVACVSHSLRSHGLSGPPKINFLRFRTVTKRTPKRIIVGPSITDVYELDGWPPGKRYGTGYAIRIPTPGDCRAHERQQQRLAEEKAEREEESRLRALPSVQALRSFLWECNRLTIEEQASLARGAINFGEDATGPYYSVEFIFNRFNQLSVFKQRRNKKKV